MSKPNSKKTSIDIRVFFTVITAAMAAAFGIGVALGPSPQLIPIPTATAGIDIDTSSESQSNQNQKQKQKNGSELGDLNERHVNFQQPVLEDFGDGAGALAYDSHTKKMNANDSDNEEEEHLPAGQHLLVDIMGVEAAFLNSETRLADAMVQSVTSAGLTMLSYHCHSLLPAGVSCVGVLLESHISFHTWPDEGVITLDLFTCGPKPLLPAVADLERLFGIPRVKLDGSASASGEKEEIITQWSHELRGFRNKEHKSYLDNRSDLAVSIFSPLLFGTKKQIVSVNSKFQRIDIWDYLEHGSTPSHDDAIKANLTQGDPRWLTSEVVSFERYLFLDGNLQSTKEEDRPFHETLVHPSMFAHPNPKSIAVIGGAEGATIREILKHEMVQSVTMIEMDEMLVQVAKEHLPFMSDCSDIVGLEGSCFENDKVNVVYEEAVQWFKDRYGPLATEEKKSDQKFDVIILDAFDPKDGADMYKDAAFIDALYASLSEEGVFGLHVGSPFSIHDPKPSMGLYAPREKFFNLLEEHPSTAAMIVYEEAHSGYDEPQAFLTVCKSVNCRSRWYERPVAIDDEIYDRIKKTKSSEPSLISYDGATHHTYQNTPKGWETVYCRREPEPFECAYRGLDLSMELHEMGNEGEGSFEIKTDTVDGKEVKSIYATVDILKGSYIMPSDVAASMTLQESVINGLKENTQVKETGDVTVIEDFLDFVDEHGHASMLEGNKLNYVEVGGTTFIRKSEDASEVNVGRWLPAHPSGKLPVFSPVYERRMMSFDVFIVATKDIKAGQEIVKPLTL